MSHPGWIYIPNWNDFQHYKNRRPAWIKLHLDLLGNDAWLDLRPEDRCLLIAIWILVGMYGNGRVKADRMWLYHQANVGQSNAYRGLERLNQAGLVDIRASRPPRNQASPEVERESSKEDKSGASSEAASAATIRKETKKMRNTRKAAERLYASCVENGDDPAFAHQQVVEEFGELVARNLTKGAA